ncbi:hypothetical protein ACFWN1_33120, partial [Streptomyces sp. NPDC058459]|uniref:hypothetical protein n=1 Tax=Streptomyces sp. NPDC058459 TaxID=3346508 RepID=UPI003663C91E
QSAYRGTHPFSSICTQAAHRATQNALSMRRHTTEPKGGEADITAERLWIPVALLQAAAAISPLLLGDPMKSTIDKAMNDLGLPHTLLNLQRTKSLL